MGSKSPRRRPQSLGSNTSERPLWGAFASVAALAAATAAAPAGCGLDRQGGLEETPGETTTTTTTTSSVGGSTGGSGVGGPIFTGGGGTGALGGGGHGGENCLNGVDDDGDGQADCADTDCIAGFGCYNIGSTTGTYVTQPAPSCPSGVATASYFDCGDCSCTATTGYCDLSATLYDRGGCTGGTRTEAAGATGGCSDITDFDDHSSDHVGAEVDAVPDGDQSCAAPAGSVAAAAYPLCATEQTGAGCPTDFTCLPSSPRPWCVVVGESDPCPSGTSPLGSGAPLYDSAGSGSCECDCSTSVLCPGGQTATLYSSSNSCSAGETFVVTPDDGCVDTQMSSIWSIDFERAPAIVECTSTPSLAEANALKLCCPP